MDKKKFEKVRKELNESKMGLFLEDEICTWKGLRKLLKIVGNGEYGETEVKEAEIKEAEEYGMIKGVLLCYKMVTGSISGTSDFIRELESQIDKEIDREIEEKNNG